MVKEQEKSGYVNAKFPAAFVHPYQFTDKNGKEWNKAIVNIPPNTKSNGIDLGGYSVDIFLNDYQRGQIASGEPVSVGFPDKTKVELFKGEGDAKETLKIDPWALTKALKQGREDYAAARQAEREAARADKDHSSSLSGRAAAAKEAAEHMSGGDDPSKDINSPSL